MLFPKDMPTMWARKLHQVVTTRNRNVLLRKYSPSNQALPRLDLRSDTVTKPCADMLKSACQAPLGDDVMGEDPTVNRLQDYAAERTGHEAALFVPTGTMANLVGIMAHCHQSASEIIVGSNSHISIWEAGNTANIAGVHARQLPEDEMTAHLSETEISDSVHDDSDDHYAKTVLLCLENTHNARGGVVLDTMYMQRMQALTDELGIRLHVDGARICHAAVAQQIPLSDLTKYADSVSICLSKGLGAPLGSVLVGSRDFIHLAKRARKRVGGGMRQAGVVAAMGLYALENNVERLVIDHQRAQTLGKLLQDRGFRIMRDGQVDSNLVFFRLPEDSNVEKADYCRKLDTEGILLSGGYSKGGDSFRLVFHKDVPEVNLETVADCMAHATTYKATN